MSHDPAHRTNPRVVNRRLHRWGAASVALPFLLVLLTGGLLQVKKQVAWVQPPELRTDAREPVVPYATVLERAMAVPEAGIRGWDDVDRIDVRPAKGMLKLVATNRWEIQMDIATGEVLQVAYRRSDLIESLHDMSWFHDGAKLWVGVPVAIIVLGLWLTGVYMWFVHLRARRRARHAGARRAAGAAGLFLLLGVPAAAQQVPDTSFRPVVDGPAHPAGQGPRVLIDEGHFNFHTVDGRYGAFAGLLRRDGFRVGAHRGRFTEASLREADILVIANALGDDGPWVLPARPAFTAEEVEVVQRWVEAGGALLLIADHMPFPGSNLAMGRAFGIEWTDGFVMRNPEESGIMTFRRADGSFRPGPLVPVDSVRAFTGSGFRLTGPGHAVMVVGAGVRDYQPQRAWEFTETTPSPSAEGMLMGALLERGRGRVAAFGEAAMFSAQLAGAARNPMGFNNPAAPHNAQFALHVVRWLGGASEGRM